MRNPIPFLLSVLLLVASGPAFAQAPSTVAAPPTAVPSVPPTSATPNCTPAQVLPGQGTGNTAARPPEPLSDKLARSDGVVCPPTGIDPDIRAPIPQTNSNMPVITPPAVSGPAPAPALR